MDIFQLAALTLCSLILTLTVKAFRPEFTVYVVLGSVVILFFCILQRFTEVFTFLQEIYDRLTYGREYFPILLKVLGVAYTADITGQLCRDSGYESLAIKVELAGKIFIFLLAIPIMRAVIEVITVLIPV